MCLTIEDKKLIKKEAHRLARKYSLDPEALENMIYKDYNSWHKLPCFDHKESLDKAINRICIDCNTYFIMGLHALPSYEVERMIMFDELVSDKFSVRKDRE